MAEHTCYLNRSDVRALLISQPDENLDITEAVLHDIDQLQIHTAEDIRGYAPATREPDDSAAVLSRFIGMVRALLRHTNPFNVNEGHAQQWMAVNDECGKLERAAPPVRSAASTVEPVAAPELLATAYLLGRGLEPSSIDDVKEFQGETWINAVDATLHLAAPTTSPEPLEDTREALSADLEKVQFELDAALLRIAELEGDDPPEPSAIFHATGLAGERLARLQGAGADMIDAMSPQSVADWTDDGNCNAGKSAPEPDAVREKIAGLISQHLLIDIQPEKRWHRGVYSAVDAILALPALSAPVAGAWQESMRRIRDFPHNDTICEQAMSQIAREALARNERQAGEPRS